MKDSIRRLRKKLLFLTYQGIGSHLPIMPTVEKTAIELGKRGGFDVTVRRGNTLGKHDLRFLTAEHVAQFMTQVRIFAGVYYVWTAWGRP